jgi:hypothetical protein
VGFEVDKVVFGTGFSPKTSIFPCQCHPTEVLNSCFIYLLPTPNNLSNIEGSRIKNHPTQEIGKNLSTALADDTK